MLNQNINAQSISDHKWENRLLLIFIENTPDSIYQKQLIELEQHKEGLLDRRIQVYQIKPTMVKRGLSAEADWKNNTEWFDKYKKENTNFEIQLIGLDGGVKNTQSTILSCEALFVIIDQMPMRRSEMKNK